MRDRLIELIKEGEDITPCANSPEFDCKGKKCRDCEREGIAKYLLTNGVIVLPCKVGDITYVFDYEVNNHLEAKFRGIAPSVVEAIVIEDEGLWIENKYAKYHISSVGEFIFLTKEEAEKALAEREARNERNGN